MKSPYVSELQPNQIITAILLVHIKDVRQKKTGDPYLSLLLGDRTGELDAKMWDNVPEVLHAFERDDFVKVKGLLQIYQNRPQLTIHKLAKVRETEVDFGDFFPSSERDPEEMFAELREIVAGVGNPHLRGLLQAFLRDEQFVKLFKIAPAAKNVHHAFLGGLLEHVLSLCQLSRTTASHYKYVDVDLLLTGAILHDIGKVAELTYDRSFGYSTEGQLLGHIVIGLRMLGEKLSQVPDFPPRLRTLIEHLIVSHHGELEFGSPKTPLFPEAMLLHHLDNLDSKMECMRNLVARDRLADGHWTAYSSSLDRAILKKVKFLDGDTAPEVPVPVIAPVEIVPLPSQPVVAAPAVVAPAEPLAPPKPIPMREKPVVTSVFAEKLQQAWHK
jgi:3'-5' exoribonuclease